MQVNSCSHMFCFDCISEWSEHENTCPLCKSRFTSISRCNIKASKGKRKRGGKGEKEKGKPMTKKVKSKSQRESLPPHPFLQMLMGSLQGTLYGHPFPRRARLVSSHSSGSPGGSPFGRDREQERIDSIDDIFRSQLSSSRSVRGSRSTGERGHGGEVRLHMPPTFRSFFQEALSEDIDDSDVDGEYEPGDEFTLDPDDFLMNTGTHNFVGYLAALGRESMASATSRTFASNASEENAGTAENALEIVDSDEENAGNTGAAMERKAGGGEVICIDQDDHEAPGSNNASSDASASRTGSHSRAEKGSATRTSKGGEGSGRRPGRSRKSKSAP